MEPSGATTGLSRVSSWSINDWLTFAYLMGLSGAWWLADPGPHKDQSGPAVLGLLAAFIVLVLVFARGNLGYASWRALAYRVGHFGSIELSYFTLAELLPAANPGTLDRQLYELDLRLFGVEPAMYFDRFVSSATTEWFSFFYYSYYFLLLSYIIPIIFFSKRAERIAEFALGMTVVGTLGQFCYLLVPGFGPYHAYPELFSNPLPEGFWWNRVVELVHAGGAQKDIFPSLHTALPTFILLFTLRHKDEQPYRFAWPVVAFVVCNIIISTMFLRWHYVIDVVAGLALAFGAHLLSYNLAPREARWRSERGYGPVWPTWK
jgi:hypothetical protein